MSTKFSNTPNYTDFTFLEKASKAKSVYISIVFLCGMEKVTAVFASK